MADKAISQLNAATSVTSVDLFVLEQSGEAKKLTGQILENWLVSFADGHGGIQSITKTGSTGTNPVIDTYTILLADETTTTFQVVNGIKGDTGDQTYVWIRYAHTYPTADSDMGTSPDEWIGIYSGTSTTAPTHYTDYTWYQFKGETGDTGAAATITAATVGYQQSDSGSVVPEGSWTTTVPTPVAGKFLWTRIQIQFNTGSPITAYSVARYGIDGTGAVSSVNSVSPDATGNVQLLAADIQTLDSQSVQAHLDDAEDDIAELKTSLRTYDRPNLLDNWYFVGGGSQQGNGQFPINQREQTTYSTANAYGIDRWKLTSGSVTLAPGGITLNGTLIQIREEALGVDAYASALLSDGTMITPTYNDSTKTFTLTATGQTIVAVKLELGHDQTLAHQENGIYVLNDFPNYSDEIAKCQRFYDKIPDSTMMMAQFISNNTIRCQIPVANLAKTPTITAGQFYIYTESGSSAALSIDSITVAYQYPNCLLVNIVPTTTYSTTVWRQLCVSARGTWEISAEL